MWFHLVRLRGKDTVQFTHCALDNGHRSITTGMVRNMHIWKSVHHKGFGKKNMPIWIPEQNMQFALHWVL